MVEVVRQVGTGQRMAEQPAGLVVRVTVGHGVEVLLDVRGGRVTMLVTTPVGVVDVDVRRVVGGQRRVELLVGVGHAACVDRNSMSHPMYGHGASHGAMSVAVGMAAGQPQGLRSVVVKLQSEKAHSLRHARFCIVTVAVGQDCGGHWASARLARPTRAERASFIAKEGQGRAGGAGGAGCLLEGLVGWVSRLCESGCFASRRAAVATYLGIQGLSLLVGDDRAVSYDLYLKWEPGTPGRYISQGTTTVRRPPLDDPRFSVTPGLALTARFEEIFKILRHHTCSMGSPDELRFYLLLRSLLRSPMLPKLGRSGAGASYKSA